MSQEDLSRRVALSIVGVGRLEQGHSQMNTRPIAHGDAFPQRLRSPFADELRNIFINPLRANMDARYAMECKRRLEKIEENLILKGHI
jgi:hypothetical protein